MGYVILNKVLGLLRAYRDRFGGKIMDAFASLLDRLLGYSTQACAEGFRTLRTACEHSPHSSELVWRFRYRAVRLYRSVADDEELTDEDLSSMRGLTDVLGDLRAAYDRLADREELQEADALRLRAFRVELKMLLSDPWDHPEVLAAALQLGEPVPERARAVIECPPDGLHYDCTLTPLGWYLLWALSSSDLHAARGGLQALGRRFEHHVFDGLADVIASYDAGDQDVACQLLMRGVNALTKATHGWLEALGSEIFMGPAQEPRHLPIGHINLQGFDLSHALLRLAEMAPAAYLYRTHLLPLYELLFAALQHEGIEQDSPAVKWLVSDEVDYLCHEVPAFAFLCSGATRGSHWSITFGCRGIDEFVGSEIDVDEGDDFHLYRIDDLTLEQLSEAEEALIRTGELRGDMSERLEGRWVDMLGTLVESSCKPELAPIALSLARRFPEEVQCKSFALGYLEQVAGDPAVSMRHYLRHLPNGKDTAPAIGNMKLLLSRLNTPTSINDAKVAVESATAEAPYAEALAQLAKSLATKFDELDRHEQWLRTGVNRWPSVSAPARKLLSVLHQIQRYRSFDELGEYAGMELKWVRIHHAKLLETGMLIEDEAGYHINPYVVEHLERESQHSVAARIVRASGTLAVKPAFNSGREYTIYQVMLQLCPNHLVFPNMSLQSLMSYEKLKELVDEGDFGYYLRASVDLVVISSTTYLPMLAIEVDSMWHDTEKQQVRDERKDRLFAASGIPFMRLRPLGSPSQDVVRGQVAEHLGQLVKELRTEMPGYEQAKQLLVSLAKPMSLPQIQSTPQGT